MFYKIRTFCNMRVGMLFLIMLTACSNISVREKEDGTHADSIAPTVTVDSIQSHRRHVSNMFGVQLKSKPGDRLGELRELEAGGVLKIDSVSMDGDKLDFAVIEFAGIKFGYNRGYAFFTSRHSRKDYRSLIREIEKYYGKGDYNYESNHYYWPGYTDPSTDSLLQIRIRPVHSDEGGIVMFWGSPI